MQPPRQRSPIPAVALLLLVHAAIVLGGVYLMLVAFGEELDSTLDTQVENVEQTFEQDLDAIRRDVRRELRRSIPAVPPTVPVP